LEHFSEKKLREDYTVRNRLEGSPHYQVSRRRILPSSTHQIHHLSLSAQVEVSLQDRTAPIRNSIYDIVDLDTFIIYEIDTDVKSNVRRKKLEDFYHPLIEGLVIVDVKKLKRWDFIFLLWGEVIKYCGFEMNEKVRASKIQEYTIERWHGPPKRYYKRKKFETNIP
jgi:hypothetical protein